MNEVFDSVYPDLLKAGLGKLNELDARHQLLALFSALEHLRRDLHEQQSPGGILQVVRQYVAGLGLFESTGFWLVNSRDFDFELALSAPAGRREVLERIVAREIKAGRFARALRQGEATFFDTQEPGAPQRGLFHVLAVSSKVVGMFCGLMREEAPPTHEITFSLLSLLLGAGADALATLDTTTRLNTQIETLRGLLPVCAWCKKIRNDRGSWEQIEKYIASRSAASFTHSICPDCMKRFEAGEL